jgi:amino acid adenylation domain-containing protein
VNTGKWSLKVRSVAVHEKINYPLGLIVGSGETISLRFAYNTALLNEKIVRSISAHFSHVLQQVLENENVKLGGITLLSQAERTELLETFNATEAFYPKDKTIVELFEEQAALNPAAIAVVFEEQQLSYGELDKRANQLAHYLRSRGVLEETLVPVCIERSIEMIVGILGILKAGGAYVPIDPEYPGERINYMLSDTHAKLIISSKASRDRLLETDIEIIELDGNIEEINSYPSHPVSNSLKPANLAYVIYTSGSTGQPKGVMIEHRSVINLAKGLVIDNGSDQKYSILQFAPLSFDASCYEIFCSLLQGGRLVLISKDSILDINTFCEVVKKANVDLVVLPPSYQVLLNNVDPGLKAIISAGEPLNVAIALQFQQHGIKMFNAYGPTENTVCATITGEPVKSGRVTIGKPLPNVRVYILNNDLKMVPVGITGEIYLAGPQLARGYLNRQSLTAERFLADPYVTGERMYRTGDLGRWLPDGNIEYLGRIDDQVKVNGYRIEVGEIETVLVRHREVSQAVVLVVQDGQRNRRLTAYIVGNSTIDRSELLAYLRNYLPEYIVPAIIVQLENLPLTANGKIDRKALAELSVTDAGLGAYAPPRTELEHQLTRIWQELLGVERIGINDNFFELGGNSILVTRMISAIRRELELELPVSIVFKLFTIGSIAAYMGLHAMRPANGQEDYEIIKV